METTLIFCTDCKLDATMHADGSIVCGCSFVSDPEDEKIPAAWHTTRENVYAMQLAESEYQQLERDWSELGERRELPSVQDVE